MYTEQEIIKMMEEIKVYNFTFDIYKELSKAKKEKDSVVQNNLTFIKNRFDNLYFILQELKEEYNIKGWTIEPCFHDEIVGRTIFSKKIIYINVVPLFYDKYEFCVDILKHEFAHVLTEYEEEAHGVAWRRMARILGVPPSHQCKSTGLRMVFRQRLFV